MALGSTGLALMTSMMAFKWWPQGPAPGLLNALLWGFLWAPAGFALSALDAGGVALGRAPLHALLIGFAGSMLVAMVTRVTQGHGLPSCHVRLGMGCLRGDPDGGNHADLGGVAGTEYFGHLSRSRLGHSCSD